METTTKNVDFDIRLNRRHGTEVFVGESRYPNLAGLVIDTERPNFSHIDMTLRCGLPDKGIAVKGRWRVTHKGPVDEFATGKRTEVEYHEVELAFHDILVTFTMDGERFPFVRARLDVDAERDDFERLTIWHYTWPSGVDYLGEPETHVMYGYLVDAIPEEEGK